MRFDLLDECSTLVPFGLGVSRKPAPQDHAAPDQPAECEAVGDSRLEMLRTLPGALRRTVWSGYRSLAEKYSCLF
jgi:hypothetical protein